MLKRMRVGGSGGGSGDVQGLIPTMTSDTTPSGTASAISVLSGQPAYLAFDKIINNSSLWHAANGNVPAWLQYEFPTPVTAKTAAITPFKAAGQTNARVKTCVFQASNDGTTWTDLTETIEIPNEQAVNFIPFTKGIGNYKYYRVNILSTWGGTTPAIVELQLYKENIVFP